MCDTLGKGWVLIFGLMMLGAAPASAQIGVALPDTSGGVGETATIPVRVDDLTGEGVLSFEFTVSYTADILSVVGVETSETIASDLSVAANTDSVGEVSVSAAGGQNLSGGGTLVKLEVQYEGTGTSSLDWDHFQFNEGSPSADLSGGSVTVEQTIPVELSSFNAFLTGTESVRLNWTTASETNNTRFDVQRAKGASSDQANWTIIGQVDGQGTTSELTEYQFTDAGLPYKADALTYRLKQVDTDGSSSHSKAVTVERSMERVQLLGTYPNPARQRTTVRYAVPDRQDVTIYLYDGLGRRVETIVDRVLEGRKSVQMDVSRLAGGVYFLRLQTEGETRTQKFTVVR